MGRFSNNVKFNSINFTLHHTVIPSETVLPPPVLTTDNAFPLLHYDRGVTVFRQITVFPGRGCGTGWPRRCELSPQRLGVVADLDGPHIILDSALVTAVKTFYETPIQEYEFHEQHLFLR
jgi:hypothetical protein